MISIHHTPPVPGADELCLQVMAAGLCRSDLAIIRGEWGGGASTEKYIPGHEFSGRVLALGAHVKTSFSVGQAVCVHPLIGCGQCVWCQQGQPEHCEASHMLGLNRDGCFTAYITVPARACFLPDGQPFTRTHWAILAYAEPVAAALGVLRAIKPHYKVAIVGHNRIAQLTQMILQHHQISAPCVAFEELTLPEHQRAYDAVVEAGLPFYTEPQAMQRVLNALKTGGRCVLKSRHAAEVSVNFSELVRRDLRLQGIYYGHFAQAVQLLSVLDLTPLLGDFYEYEQYADFLDSAHSGESKKAFFFPGWI